MSDLVTIENKEIKKLLELNEELENYFRNTIIPQLFVDADLILRKFSPPANAHFKLTAPDIGRSIYDIPTLADLDGLVETIQEVVTNNTDLEKEIQTSDNRWFQMNILPYIIKKENLTNGVVITFVDITERINDKNDIERINADHETFIYTVSHDFRAPLTNMVLLLELLKSAIDKNDRADMDDLLGKAVQSARSMKVMINELTDLTQIGTDLIGNQTAVNVAMVLHDVLFTLKNEIYRTHAKITTHLTIPELYFSKKNLRSILFNLVSNAIKFARPEVTPEVLITTEDAGEFTLLTVKDNGIGIEESKQKEIFTIFTRLRPQTEGTGVGLFIVSKMVCNQGGKIEVESEPMKGTTFSIYFKNSISA